MEEEQLFKIRCLSSRLANLGTILKDLLWRKALEGHATHFAEDSPQFQMCGNLRPKDQMSLSIWTSEL